MTSSSNSSPGTPAAHAAPAFSATLRWKVNLRSRLVFLRTEESRRQDEAKKFLEDNIDKHSPKSGLAATVHGRLITYLFAAGLIQENEQLTAAGQKLLKDGMRLVPEAGKYRVWYSVADPVFGRYLFWRERKGPNRENKGAAIDHNEFPMVGCTYTLLDGNQLDLNQVGGADEFSPYVEDAQGAVLSATWRWTSLEQGSASLELTGDLQKQVQQPKALPTQQKPADRIIKFLPAWDGKERRLACGFDEVENAERLSFLRTWSAAKVDGFESVEIKNIPLMARDKSAALAWRAYLIERALEEGYLNQQQYDQIVARASQKPGLAMHGPLPAPAPDVFLRSYFASHERGKAYWHLAALIDLNPTHNQDPT